MIQMSSEELYFRAAIALNNIGVTLLRHGIYQDSAKTFQDAMTMVQMPSRCEGTAQEAKQMSEMLERANRRLAKASNLGTTFLENLRVITSDDGLQEIMHDLKEDVSSTKYCILITSATTESLQEETPDLLGATITYNFAVSCFCKGNTCSVEQHMYPLFQHSLKLFQLSETILTTEEFSMNGENDYHVYLLSVLLTRSLTQICILIGSPLSQKYHCMLDDIMSSIRLEYAIIDSCNAPCSAGAA